ncbi:MAG: DUF2604 domain-containing protein [Nitrosopumilus sp.]|nr:DUF2604 domain-containing protein [Nitrosopumilus sp.]
MSGNPKFIVTFVIQGKEFPVEVNPNQPVKAGVVKALQDSGNQGNPNEWQVRTEGGAQLDMNKSFADQGITSPTKLFLSKGPGRGG